MLLSPFQRGATFAVSMVSIMGASVQFAAADASFFFLGLYHFLLVGVAGTSSAPEAMCIIPLNCFVNQ